MARCTRLRQSFDREKDGRIFTCAHCAFSVCVACDRPEHANESCSEYRRRLNAVHGDAEAQTRKAYKVCPDCDATIEPAKASCYTQCNCGYQFCSACMTPWVGEGSAYLHGKEAHWPGCKYRTRDVESKHSLVNRWQQTEEVQDRLAAKAESNHTRNETRKRARMEEASGLETSMPAKKKRMPD